MIGKQYNTHSNKIEHISIFCQFRVNSAHKDDDEDKRQSIYVHEYE